MAEFTAEPKPNLRAGKSATKADIALQKPLYKSINCYLYI